MLNRCVKWNDCADNRDERRCEGEGGYFVYGFGFCFSFFFRAVVFNVCFLSCVGERSLMKCIVLFS